MSARKFNWTIRILAVVAVIISLISLAISLSK